MSPAKQWERENEERSEKMALEEILEIARKNGACKVQLAAAEKHASLATLLADPNAPRWAWWLRLDCNDLPTAIARQAERVACQSSQWACRLRRYCNDLPAEVVKQIEEIKRIKKGERE